MLRFPLIIATLMLSERFLRELLSNPKALRASRDSCGINPVDETMNVFTVRFQLRFLAVCIRNLYLRKFDDLGMDI